MPLYGFELSEEISPLAGGQGWAVKLDKPDFVGRDALLAQRDADDFERIAGIVLSGKVPARHGYPVFHDGERVGVVCSATFSPSYGDRQIATALLARNGTSSRNVAWGRSSRNVAGSNGRADAVL